MRDLQKNLAAPEIGKLQVRQSAGIHVRAHHPLRHSTPSNATEQEGVFGGEIANPPDLGADHAIVARIPARLLREYKLKMLSRGARHCAAGKSQRVFWSRHRDHLDALKVQALQPIALHVNDCADPNPCGSITERALDLAKRCGLQAKRHSRELAIKALEQLDETVVWKHDIGDERYLGVKSLPKPFNPSAQHLRAVGDGFCLGNDGFPGR